VARRHGRTGNGRRAVGVRSASKLAAPPTDRVRRDRRGDSLGRREPRALEHPPAWPIAAQTFRVGVELALFALHAAGRAPVQITFEGRNFDVLVGLSAPWIGWLVATGRIGTKGALAWNVIGLAVLANTVGTVATSTPGPLHLDWPGAPLTAITSWPIVWLPAFLMPIAVFLHVVSLRQNLRRLRAASGVQQT